MEYNLEKQHAKGKLHAIERIQALCDEGSFMEIYSGVRHNCTSFGMETKDLPYDGVITGFGRIEGRPVAVYAQDFTVQGGSLGLMHGRKIAELIEKAIAMKCPVIGINDSGGARIQEGVDSLCGYGEIFYQNVRASGAVPQISIVAGPCAGGAVYSPGITDFIFAVDKVSQLFITGPKVVKSVMFMDISEEDLGGAAIHAQKSGVVHFRSETEAECYRKVRALLALIPHSAFDKEQAALGNSVGAASIHPFGALGNPDIEAKFKYDEKKKTLRIAEILPQNPRAGYNVREVIDCITDDDTFLEVSAEFAVNCVTGFARIAGGTVGIVANNPGGLGGVLNCDASDKIARFVRWCDAFGVPLVTLVDVPGFIPGPDEEQKGIIRHGAKVIYAYSEATVPKVTVILRKAYGGAYIAMCSKHLGADAVYAWPASEIAVMGAEGAIGILYGKLMRDPALAAEVETKSAEYKAEIMTPKIAARRGYVSEVIEPAATRSYVAKSLAFLAQKGSADKVQKRHGNIPL